MFWFYIIPLLVCILSGAYFFTSKHKNVALGLVMCVMGFTPMINIVVACIGVIVLIVMALKNV